MKKQKHFPLDIKISFQKIINEYRKQIETETSEISKEYLARMLDYVASFPQLMEGIENAEDLVKLKDPIRILLKDLFPGILSKNQIKAVSVPFHNVIFNSTEKFREILRKAGDGYELSMRNLDEDLDYIYACVMILNCYYGYNIDFSRPLYYDIPDENGIPRHYRIELNSDFIEILPTEKAKDVTGDDVNHLIQNMEQIELWKELFPPNSWIFKGFTIVTLTDVTVDDAISDLKTALLQQNTSGEEELQKFEEIFKSIFKIANLKVGFTVINEKESVFEQMAGGATSFLLDASKEIDCDSLLGEAAYEALVEKKTYFSISDIENCGEDLLNTPLYRNLKKAGAKSAILAPIAKNQKLLAILELISFEDKALNNVTAKKLDEIIPYIVTAVERNRNEFENRVKAVIQSECTSIHPSVLWAFEKEAKKFIKDLQEDGLASFKDIVFNDVYPLYGQIDIVASSEARNKAIQKDLLHQLDLIEAVITRAREVEVMSIYEQVQFRIREFKEDLQENLSASSEQKVFELLQKEVQPLMHHISDISSELKEQVESYRQEVNSESGIIYNHRKNYDEAVQQINRTMARFIDRQQVEAQKIYPHYFERYKTDGVEHNIYIGSALTPHLKKFDKVYLYNLRLWQLRTMCEMENKFYALQENMPITLEAASLILVYSNTLAIRYRMDEKHFDVDGTYNARYEVIKKRIDKAYVKDTEERITQKGKITIVYSQREDEREYLRYIKYLQAKKYLGQKVELLELEDVQGVVGLKALRVEVLYNLDETSSENIITYENLMEMLD